jgi:hypothetical protein
MARHLNPNKPHATVWGNDPNIKHRYEQDGKLFDGEGREVNADGKLVDAAAAPGLAAKDDESDQLTKQTQLTESDNADELAAQARAALVAEATVFLAGKSIDVLKGELPDVADELLDVMIEAETAGQSRKGALEAIAGETADRLQKASGAATGGA